MAMRNDFIFLPLHGDPWLLRGPLWTNWQVSPPILIGLFLLVAAYILLVGPMNTARPDASRRPIRRSQRVSFIAGCVVLLLALGPPLEDWAGLLLAGHMSQLLLLMFLVPPLLLYGLPGWLLEPILRVPGVRRTGYILTRPAVSFALAAFVIVVWHLPPFYDAALQAEPLHILQHQMYIVTSLLVWWPLLGNLDAWPRSTPLVQCLFLFALTFPGAFVGSFLTLGEPGVYETYKTVPRVWGIDLATDQQAAGLAMWVGGGVVYLLLITVVFFRWANREEAKDLSRDAVQPVQYSGGRER